MASEIAKLRKALGDDSKTPKYIQTVRTRGYRFIAEVREQNGKIVPVKEREIIRAAGPTVHKHTGKQAGQYNV